jgi:hypothetical protein
MLGFLDVVVKKMVNTPSGVLEERSGGPSVDTALTFSGSRK